MIGEQVGYDLLFTTHILGALATVTILVVLRVNAASALSSTVTDEDLRRRFPQRTNWAARVIHVMPVSGLALSVTGDASVRLSQPWVGTGLVLYLAAAYWLEARALPAERSVAASVGTDNLSAPARVLGRELDVVLALVAATLLVMVVQF